jgi:hypothetical protein
VKIICGDHGVFEQIPSSHLNGKGCHLCGGTAKLDTETFIKLSTSKHNGKYDYSLVDYVNNRTKVKIICGDHGVFDQRPNHHLNGSGCDKCRCCASLGTETFIKRSTSKHKGRYDYSLVEYVGFRKKVKIVCPKHGEFLQTPNNHLQGAGCPGCAKNGYDPLKPGRIYYLKFDFGHTIL